MSNRESKSKKISSKPPGKKSPDKRKEENKKKIDGSKSNQKKPKNTTFSHSRSKKNRPSRKPIESPHRTTQRSFPRRLFRFLMIGLLWGLFVALIVVFWASYDLPDVEKLSSMPRQPNITLLARDGKRIATLGDYYDLSVNAADLPKHVKGAFIATEDRRFYGHFGLDPIGILRALARNLSGQGGRQGGSTITQQLAKNFLLTEGLYTYRDRSVRRKIQELLLSFWLEAKFTKNQILSIYLNRVYFGAGAYGLRAAARTYFDRKPEKLTIKQAALLAGLLKAPSKFSPFASPERSEKRTRIILGLMRETDVITKNDLKIALKSSTGLHTPVRGNLFARYFLDWVLEEATHILGQINQDLVISTTLDSNLQRQLEKLTREVMNTYSKDLNISEVAALLLTPTGSVRALIGGASYKNSQFNRAVQAKRQVGSIFKLPVFLAGLENGLRVDRLVLDEPISIGGWQPKNYGWKTRGEITIQDAFAYSVNTSTIRIARYAGLKKVHECATRLGINCDPPKDYTFALGTAESSLLELTSAFAVFLNEGFRVKPTGISQIKTKSGSILYQRQASDKRIVNFKTYHKMRELLSAVMNYGTGRNIRLDQPCYGKSGTTQDYHDAWFVGFTDAYVMGVWMGNDDNQPMKKVTGAKIPGKLWQKFMKEVAFSS